MNLKWGTAALLTALAACSSSEPDATESASGDELTAGQIVAGDSPFYWANIDYEQHRATMQALGAPLSVHDTPSDDIIRVRLQAWADRFDAVLRRVTRNTTAPKPIVNVLSSAQTYNAWSSGTYVRLGASFGDTSATPAPLTLLGLVAPASGVQGDWTSIAGLLPQAPGWGRLASFTQVWNLAKGPCQLASRGRAFSLAPGATAGCEEHETAATEVGTVATTPFLTFSSDLVAMMPSERALVAVLAHELGHMYRAHSSPLTERKYGFWYDDGAHTAKRPVPSALDSQLRGEYTRLVRTAHATDAIVGAHFHVRSRLPILGLAYLGAFDSCEAFSGWRASHDLEGLTTQARDGAQLFGDAAATYLSFEQIVQSCPRADVFAEVAAVAEVGEITQLPLTSINTSLTSILPGAQFPAPALGETVAVYLDRLEAGSASDEVDEVTFIAKIRNERIGLYTAEQEADEIALELMTRVGYTEQEVIDAWHESGVGFEELTGRNDSLDDPGSASATQCGTWLRDEFQSTTPAGAHTPVLMSLGSLADSHHGDCYRLYNLWREAKAHRIPAVAPFAPLSPSWEEIQAHAVELTEAAAADGH